MKKKFILVLLGAFLLGGCSKAAPEKQEEENVSSEIQVTQVKVFPSSGGKELSRANIVLNGVLAIEDVKLMQGTDGPFLAMPRSYQKKKNKYYNLFFINEEVKDLIRTAIENKKPTGTGSGFEITDVRVYPFDREGSWTKGFAQVTLNEAITLKSITIKESRGGDLYLGFPARKIDGKYKDWYYPINKGFRKQISDRVLSEFQGP